MLISPRRLALASFSCLLAASCSSSDSTPAGGGSDASNQDTGSSGDAGSGDSSSTDTGGGGDTGATFRLTIDNYLSWCSVSVDGGTPTTATPITVDVAPNAVVHLHADPVAGFIWGYWYGTPTDGATKDTQTSQTVTVTKDMKIQACCPTQASPTCPPP